MPKKLKDPKHKWTKTEWFHVGMTLKMRRLLREVADKLEMSDAEFVRTAVEEKIGRMSSNEIPQS